jgi:hypothetical protein
VAVWVLSLLVITVTWHFIGWWTSRSFVPLSAGASPWVMLAPYAPLTILALLGWRATWQAEVETRVRAVAPEADPRQNGG